MFFVSISRNCFSDEYCMFWIKIQAFWGIFFAFGLTLWFKRICYYSTCFIKSFLCMKKLNQIFDYVFFEVICIETIIRNPLIFYYLTFYCFTLIQKKKKNSPPKTNFWWMIDKFAIIICVMNFLIQFNSTFHIYILWKLQKIFGIEISGGIPLFRGYRNGLLG